MLDQQKGGRVLTLRPRQTGISLIETMIGLTIVGLLMSVGIPSFSSYLQNVQIRNAAEAIKNGLSYARGEAVRRNTNVQFQLGTGSSWTVGCVVVSGTNCPATIQARDAAQGSGNASLATSEIVGSTNATVATPVFTNTLAFNGVGKSVTLPSGNNAIFDVTNTNGGGRCVSASGAMRCLRIVVTSGGQIRMCDPARSSSVIPRDPQAC